MGPQTTYLLTLLQNCGLNGYILVRVALATDLGEEYFMEPDARKRLHAQLPAHVRSIGPIVYVEELFAVVLKP